MPIPLVNPVTQLYKTLQRLEITFVSYADVVVVGVDTQTSSTGESVSELKVELSVAQKVISTHILHSQNLQSLEGI